MNESVRDLIQVTVRVIFSILISVKFYRVSWFDVRLKSKSVSSRGQNPLSERMYAGEEALDGAHWEAQTQCPVEEMARWGDGTRVLSQQLNEIEITEDVACGGRAAQALLWSFMIWDSHSNERFWKSKLTNCKGYFGLTRYKTKFRWFLKHLRSGRKVGDYELCECNLATQH